MTKMKIMKIPLDTQTEKQIKQCINLLKDILDKNLLEYIYMGQQW